MPIINTTSKFATLRKSDLCRSTKRRVSKVLYNETWCAEGACTLNELSGAPFSGDVQPCPPNAAQSAALAHLSSLYARVPAPPSEFTPAGAFKELCGSASRYCPSPAAKTARCCMDNVSWPPSGSSPVNVSELLEGDDHLDACLWRDRVLKAPEERSAYRESRDRVKPYLEPSLVRRRPVYASFLHHLFLSGMIRFRPRCESYLGIFFVVKKSGKLRIIFDTRDVNNFFRRPPKTALPTPAAFAGIESVDEGPLWFAGGDIQDCFYHLAVPEGLDEYFTLPAVRACDAPWALVEGMRPAPDTWITPCLQVLPMGWAWSLHWAQRSHVSLCRSVSEDCCDMVENRKVSHQLTGNRTSAAVYVDNYLFIGGDRDTTNRHGSQHAKSLIKNKLPIHEVTMDTNEITSGYTSMVIRKPFVSLGSESGGCV